MKTTVVGSFVFTLWIATSAHAAAHQQPADKEQEFVALARSFVAHLVQGEFASAVQMYDDTMRSALPEEKLVQTWQGLIAMVGPFEQQGKVRTEQLMGYDIAYVRSQFKNKTLDIKVVFDRKRRVAGLFFLPAPPVPDAAPSDADLQTAQYWKGSISHAGMNVAFVARFHQETTGQTAGVITIPLQGVHEAPLQHIEIDGQALRFTFRPAQAAVEARFDLQRTNDANAEGFAEQGGIRSAVTMTKVGRAEAQLQRSKRPQTPGPPFPYIVRPAAYTNDEDGIRLAGTLTLPEGGGRHPAVIMITGSGPQDRDETLFEHKPFLVIADHLARHGIATLRVDDRGVGGSSGNIADATSERFASDVAAGIEYLKSQPEINRLQIGLIGHSEGGTVAGIAAQRYPEVAFIILLAGCGLPGDQILALQMERILRQSGVAEQNITRQLAAQKQLLTHLKQGSEREVVEKALRHLITEQMPAAEPRQIDAAVAQSMSQMMSPWFQAFLKLDPRTFLREVRCPVLALNGMLDVQVPAEINLREIEQALRSGDNTDVTTRSLPGLNHLFQKAATGLPAEYAAIEQTIDPPVLNLMTEWIHARVQAHHP